MKKIICFLIVLGIAIFLSGCDLDLFMEIDLASFSEEETEPVTIMGVMNVEVQACKKNKTDMPSDAVFELQAKIPYVFKGAEYLECKKKGSFDRVVSFSIPAFLDREPDGLVVDEEIMNISYYARDTGSRPLATVEFPPVLQGKIKSFFDSSASSFMKLSEFRMSFRITPDVTPLPIGVMGVYFNDTPSQTSEGNVTEPFVVTIPTYGIEQLIRGSGMFMLFYVDG